MNENMKKVQEQTTVHEGGGMCIDGAEGIEHLRVLSAITELAFRVNTGGRMTRVNIIQFCAQEYGTKGKTNKKVLAEMVHHYENFYGREITSMSTVARALGLKTEGEVA